jgi:hypothetical protein
MVLHPSGHPPHIKHAKHLIYVWSGSGMSIKRMGSPNHSIISYSMSPVRNQLKIPWLCSVSVLAPSRVMVWYYISLEQPTTYKVCQTPFKCMMWIWYEYEVDEMSQLYPTACPNPKWETHSESYSYPSLCPPPFRAMVWYGVVAIWLPAMVEGF